MKTNFRLTKVKPIDYTLVCNNTTRIEICGSLYEKYTRGFHVSDVALNMNQFRHNR